MKIRSGLLISFLALLLIPAFGQSKHKKPGFNVVGYYSYRAAMTADLKTAPFDKLTHINLWFLNPDTMGNFNQDFSGLAPFVKAAHDKKVKVLFSIAGGSRHTYYAKLLKDDRRPSFINDLLLVVLKYNLDGIDVDIEGADIDENYENFVVGLKRTLSSQKKIMTAALAFGTRAKLTDIALAQYDLINIMSYDQTGPWRPERPGPHSTYDRAVADLTYFGTERKIPKEKITLGVPFYGYGFGPETTSPASSMNYGQIITTFPGSDMVDQWNMPGGKIIYYNGAPTIKQKTLLAKEKAGGVMIWQVLGDAQGPNSLLKVINDTAHGKK
jgi:chitinase